MNCGILEINLLINSEENVHLLFLSKKTKRIARIAQVHILLLSYKTNPQWIAHME